MLIKWTFIFDTNHMAIEVREEAEDKRISESVEAFVDLLFIPSPGKEAFINLKSCKAIIREEVQEPHPEVIAEPMDIDV